MKRTKTNRKLWATVATLTLLPFSADAGIFKAIGKAVRDVLPQPHIESPALQHLGVSVDGERMIVTNGTKFYAELFVYDKLVGILGPGDVAHDNRHFEPLNPQVPFAARIYEEYDGKDLRGYIGVAMQSLFVSSGSGGSSSWIIRTSDIRKPDGGWVDGDAYPTPDARPASKKKGFPREWWNATASIQIAQNTNFDAVMRVDGVDRATLGPGDLYFFSARELGFRGRTVTFQLVLTDRGRPAGTWETQIFVPSEGLPAYQFIVGPNDIQRTER